MNAILLASGLLLIGLVLRLKLRVLKFLYIPAAVVAGVLGLVLVQSTARLDPIAAEWRSWPGTLIAIVFAGLLLERPQEGGLAVALKRGLRSGLLAWIIILGQLVIGLVVYITLVPKTIPATFAQMLEISWAGGHGTAAGMGVLYTQQGFPAGRDIAFFCATVGLIYGVLSGLFFVNLALRRGWVAKPLTTATTADAPRPMALGLVPGAVIDPIMPAVIALAMSVAVGLGLQFLFLKIAGHFLGASFEYAKNVPLFLFTLLGGYIVRRLATLLRCDRYIDPASVARIVGVSMEFLIVAGIATMRIESLSAFALPLIALLVLAAAWSALCLLVLSRWLLPQSHWFELGLLNYGFSTANTPQGMMLLRIVDPELRSPAARDYAIAAPLSAPFIGGGVITFLVLPVLLARFSPVLIAGVIVAMMIALLFAGLRLASRDHS